MQNIGIYYESLKRVHSQIVDWRERKPPLRERITSFLFGITAVILFLSILPVLPVILLFAGGQAGLVVGPLNLIQFTLGQFVLAWVVTAIGALVIFLLMLWINEKVGAPAKKPARPPQILSPEQLTFIAVYEAYKELKVFFVSHIDQHVDNSLSALASVRPSARDRAYIERRLQGRRLTPEETEMIYPIDEPVAIRYGPRASFPRQLSIAQEFLLTFEKYAWFQLDSTTKSNLQALISFPEKIFHRLRQREDLPAVLSVLENLSKFTYAYLPEHKANMDPEALEKLLVEGAECLRRFVQEVNELTHYSPEPEQTNTEVSQPTRREKLQRFYYHNVFFRFSLWFVLILLLTTGAVFLTNQFVVKLSPEAMATLVIGSSVAGAAGLARFLPRDSRSQQKAGNQAEQQA